MLDRLEFVFGEAIIALRRNSWMTFAAVTTAAVALFLLGSLGYAYVGISRYAQTLPGVFDMRVLLKEEVKGKKLSEAAEAMRKIDGVKSVTWIPSEKMWALKKREDPRVYGLIENPFPESFKVVLADLNKADAVADEIRGMAPVLDDGVQYLQEEQQLLSQILTLLRFLGIGLGGLMLLTSGVLIYNAIRMTIVARRKEIRIMHLVGANRVTVITPLLIEGLLQGAAGGFIAAFLLWSAHRGLGTLLERLTSLFRLPSLELLPWMTYLVLAGAAYGLVCSLLAVRDPNRYRTKSKVKRALVDLEADSGVAA
ncbi:MAG TPA: permease-like cell division protein FtsX [Fimbriimonadaceae bacterium]|nr:permease-like cell division protein FtsX [Fimbriimonadaceae bacterium]